MRDHRATRCGTKRSLLFWCGRQTYAVLCPNVTRFFRRIFKGVAGSKACNGSKGVTSPSCGRGHGSTPSRERQGAAARSNTLISKIPCVSVPMLNGKSQFVLDFQKRLLAGDRQLYVRAGLKSSRKDRGSTTADIAAVLLEWTLAFA